MGNADLASVMAELKRYQRFTELLQVPELGTGRLIQYRPNSVQQRLHNRITVADREGRPARIIVLKARQFGISTHVQSIFVHRAMTRAGFKALTVAHEAGNAQTLFEIGQNFYAGLPSALKDVVHVEKGVRGKRLLLSNRSDLNVETANDKDAGRGTNAQAMHMSEVASWTDGYVVAQALRQIVQPLPGTLVVMESTPKGASGFFYDEYFRAKEHESDYEALFFPWFDFERNVEPSNDSHYNGQREFIYQSDDEIELREQYNLSDGQLLWRRTKLSNECGGDALVFAEEYPSDDISCFLTSGRLFFSGVLIDRFVPSTPELVGDIRGYASDKETEATSELAKGYVYRMFEAERGPLHRFRDVQAHHRYVGFIDIAGVSSDHSVEQFTGNDSRDAEDYSVIWIIDCSDMRTVAVWRDRVDADVLAHVAYRLGFYYNRALLAPEVNGAGMVVHTHLNILRYPRLYQRTLYDTRGEPTTSKEGWLTTSANRPMMLENLKLRLRDAPESLCDARLKREMGAFEIKNGRPQARAGQHDDLVIAAAGAVQVASEYPQVLKLDPTGIPVKRKPQTYKGRIYGS